MPSEKLARRLAPLVFACLAAPVFSQNTANTLPDSLPDAQLRQVVVTAQFAPTELRQTVNTVRVLGRKTIDSRAASNLEDLLRSEPGLRIQQDALLGSALRVNGLQGSNLKILVDGVPVIGTQNGNVDAGQLSLSAVGQVEIVEGAQSLMYGSGASGGVINLVSRVARQHRVEGGADVLYESGGYFNRNARAATRLGQFSLSANAGLSNFDPRSDSAGRAQTWDPKAQKFAGLNLRFSPGKQLDLRLAGNLLTEKISNLGDVRRPTYKPYAFDDFYSTDRSDVALNGTGRFAQIFWQTTAAYNQFGHRKNTFRLDFDDQKQSLLPDQQDTASGAALLLRSTFASQKSTPLNWLAGLEFYRQTLHDGRILDTTLAETGFAKNRELALFSSVKWAVSPQLILQTGARWTWNERFGQAISPALWLRWLPGGDWTIRASWARGFRSPDLKELYFRFVDVNHHVVGNPDLRPEHSDNFRAEATHPIFQKDDWSASATVHGFFNSVRDRIVLTFQGTGIEYAYQNVENYRTMGAGAAFRLEKSGRLEFQTALVVTGFHNNFLSQDSMLLTLLWSPDWSNELTLFLLKKRLTVNVLHKMTGSLPYFFKDGDRTVEGKTGAWQLLNASVSGTFWQSKIRLTAGVKNLLDVRPREAGAADAVGHQNAGMSQPAHWGRTVFGQASVSF